jgi:hypothetical protein
LQGDSRGGERAQGKTKHQQHPLPRLPHNNLTIYNTSPTPSTVPFPLLPQVWRVREAYKNQVDFVFVQGDTPEAMDLVDFFHVDAIPHITFVSSSGVIKNNLIGKAPREIFEESIKSLLEGTEPRFAMETGAEGKNVKTFVANNMKDVK